MRQYTETGQCVAWGSDWNARRVSGLTRNERQAIRDGQKLYLAGCPEYLGQTDRVIITLGGRFYCRMPE